MSTYRVRSDNVAWQEIDDELIVLDETRSTYVRLAGTGPSLWPGLLKGSELGDMVDTLCREFDVDATVAREDVTAFLAELVELELVVEVP